MGAAIQIFVVIFIIVAVIKKDAKKKKQIESKGGTYQTAENRYESTGSPVQKTYQPARKQTPPEKINQQELKQRLLSKYASESKSSQDTVSQRATSYLTENSIFQRAFANAAGEFGKKEILNDISDIITCQEKSELMQQISDIMAKGMDTEPAFQRDFVAEGMDMINRITV